MMPRWKVVLLLTVVWLLLWGAVTPTLVVGGLLASVAVLLLFPFPPAPYGWTLRPWPAAVLLGRFAWDLVRASADVAWIALRPAAPPLSAVVRVPLHTRSDLLLTATAELVSLVPGSIMIELDPREPVLFLHVLDAATPEKIEDACRRVHLQERRVVEAFAPRAERDEYRRLVAGSDQTSASEGAA